MSTDPIAAIARKYSDALKAIRSASPRAVVDIIDGRTSIGEAAWRHLERNNTRWHDLPGWPACTCCDGTCEQPATCIDDNGIPTCVACQKYACDDDGQSHCGCGPDVREVGEWTGGGMSGTPRAWVSRMVYRPAAEGGA